MNNWLTNAIALEAKYDEGYEAGKQAVVEQIFEELEEILTNEIYLDVRRACVDEDGSFMPGPFMNLMLDIKQKYGVK